MSDMERAQILHQLTKRFNVPPEVVKDLQRQIEDPRINENFARIKSGLDVEDSYKAVFSALPWIKNINGLHQEQEEKYKASYQVPDCSMLVENAQKGRFSLFVEVKFVRGNKAACEIMVKQKHVLNNYARDYDVPLLIAIYWERLGYWTHNCLENFGGSKKNKISCEEAIKNDMSHVLSDYAFMVDRPFFRKTVFSSGLETQGVRHKKYGAYHSSFLGLNKEALRESDVMESSVIDCMFQGEEVSVWREGELTCLMEKFVSVPKIVKLNNWIMNFLALWGAKAEDRAGVFKLTEMARIVMVELMDDVKGNLKYMLPASKNKGTDRLIELAYKDTEVEFHYKNSN